LFCDQQKKMPASYRYAAFFETRLQCVAGRLLCRRPASVFRTDCTQCTVCFVFESRSYKRRLDIGDIPLQIDHQGFAAKDASEKGLRIPDYIATVKATEDLFSNQKAKFLPAIEGAYKDLKFEIQTKAA
jgi:hypothetical protein